MTARPLTPLTALPAVLAAHAITASRPCPVHGSPLTPVGGGARGICEQGGETRQMEALEVTP